MTSQSSRRPYKAWSNAELDAMTEIYATGNLPELAERFGVSMQQLRDKASHMGLRREKGTKTSPDDNEPEPDTEPAQPPEQYAICRSGQAHLSAWLLRDMSLDTAKQLAVDDAVATHGEVVLYRCTPIGRAVPRIVFEDA